MTSFGIESARTPIDDEPAREGGVGPSGRRMTNVRQQALTFTSQVAVFVVVVAAWQIAVSTGFIQKFYISQPTDVLHKFWDDLSAGSLYDNLWVTTRELLYGLVVGGVTGTIVGFGLGASPRTYRAFSPLITTLYTLPRVALISLFILWFGVGPNSKVALVASLVFFSMLFNAYAGVRSIERKLIDNVRLLGGRRRDILRQIYLPGTAPWLFAGLRISLVFAVTGAVVGEMLASRNGLGYVLQQRTSLFDAKGTISMLVIIAILATLLSGVIGLVERYAVRWRDDRNV